MQYHFLPVVSMCSLYKYPYFVNKNIRNNCELTALLKQRKNDIESLMEQGFIPYEIINGCRVHNLDFSEKYVAYVAIGAGSQLIKVNN